MNVKHRMSMLAYSKNPHNILSKKVYQLNVNLFILKPLTICNVLLRYYIIIRLNCIESLTFIPLLQEFYQNLFITASFPRTLSVNKRLVALPTSVGWVADFLLDLNIFVTELLYRYSCQCPSVIFPISLIHMEFLGNLFKMGPQSPKVACRKRRIDYGSRLVEITKKRGLVLRQVGT